MSDNGRKTTARVPEDKRKIEAALSKLGSIIEDRTKKVSVRGNDDISDTLKSVELELRRLRKCMEHRGSEDVDAEKGMEWGVESNVPTDRNTIIAALSELCSGIVSNSSEIERLYSIVAGLPHVRKGDIVLNRMLASIDSGESDAAISRRERQVLIQLLGGKTNREISGELGISEKTVKNHLWRIYRKLGVNNRTQLFHRLISA